MNRAIQLGYATINPCVRMGFKRTEPKAKNPWTDEEIGIVMKAIAFAPQWIAVTFLLGLYQAARLRQCMVPIADIDLKNKRITYWKTVDGRPLTKGNKPFTQPIDDRLLPKLREIIAARKAGGHRSLCDLPSAIPSVEWREFLDVCGLPRLVHHGLRVTWITRAAVSGVPMALAKRFVNHGSTSVHEIYQRLYADDIAHVPGALNLPDLTS